MGLRKPSANSTLTSSTESLPTAVLEAFPSAPIMLCASVCQGSFCMAYILYNSFYLPCSSVFSETWTIPFSSLYSQLYNKTGQSQLQIMFVDWVIPYGLKSLPGFEVLNPSHSPQVWMTVRIKQIVDEVFKLFTDVRFFEGSILVWALEEIASILVPTHWDQRGGEQVFVLPVFLCGITCTASIRASAQAHKVRDLLEETGTFSKKSDFLI